MVPERPVGPCYHSRWPSWHDSSPRKPRSPCKSTRQAFPLSLRTSTSIFSFGRFQTDYFRSLSLSSVWFSFHFVCRLLETTSECAERFHTPGNIPDERERKRERERERERAFRPQLAIRVECVPRRNQVPPLLCWCCATRFLFSRISRYDEYYFSRSNYFPRISKVIAILSSVVRERGSRARLVFQNA